MKELLKQLEKELNWSMLKHQDKKVAEMMVKLAPRFTEQTIKLAITRNIQAQSTKKRKPVLK